MRVLYTDAPPQERPLLDAGPWGHAGRRPASAMPAAGRYGGQAGGQWPGQMAGRRPASAMAEVARRSFDGEGFTVRTQVK